MKINKKLYKEEKAWKKTEAKTMYWRNRRNSS